MAELVNVPDISVVVATVTASLMDDHREEVIGVIRVFSISL